MPEFHGSATDRANLLAYLGTLGGINAGPLTHAVPPVSQAEMDAVMHPRPGDWATYNGKRDGNHDNGKYAVNPTGASSHRWCRGAVQTFGQGGVRVPE